MDKRILVQLISTDNKKNFQKTSLIQRLVFLVINLDTGQVFIEESNSNRKIEPVPMGFYVHLCTMGKAKQLKKRFENKPYLIEKFLNR